MYKIFFLALALHASFLLFAQTSKAEMAIQKVLDNQVEAWNRGDIGAFMEGYWKNDQLTFVGSQGPQYGWQTAYDRYLRTYNTPEKMGTLKFGILKREKIGKRKWLVLGTWYLTRSIDDVGGTFTLIFRKIKGEWKVVYDHTS
jgi:ketosteroid isomerase-like protein